MRYNPFSNKTHDKYNATNLSEIEDVSEIARLLYNCQSLSSQTFKKFMSDIDNPEIKNKPSIIFNNIGGNSSNFDQFSTTTMNFLL